MARALSLSFNEQVKQLVPAWLYYPHKIAKCARDGEPELNILRDLVPAGCTALDIGANRGYYSYALSKIASRVEAFEPHPELANFIRRKLQGNVTVNEVALSNRSGSMPLYIPQRKQGVDVHYNSSLKKVYPFERYIEAQVRVAKLDEFHFNNVGFIKIDVEGSDMDVIEGGQQTIAANRPNMVVEITALTNADPLGSVEQVEAMFGYQARVMLGGRLIGAREALREPRSDLRTCNVVFTPN